MSRFECLFNVVSEAMILTPQEQVSLTRRQRTTEETHTAAN